MGPSVINAATGERVRRKGDRVTAEVADRSRRSLALAGHANGSAYRTNVRSSPRFVLRMDKYVANPLH